MKITIKGIHLRNKKVDEDLRGRSYIIGEITAGVDLTDEGLILTITNNKLAQDINYALNWKEKTK